MPGDSISESGQASHTAMMTAAGRGWHRYQYGRGAIHDDWLGWPLVGPEVEQLLATIHGVWGDSAFSLANFIAARSRIAEDWFEASGIRQYVLLGAGLDSYAWRAPEGVTVYEVDHPASQRWKQDRLASMMIDPPDSLVWVGVDFERDSVREKLELAGLETDQPAFVSWLGVTAYLTRESIRSTLADLPASEIAVTYTPPESDWDPAMREVSERFLPVAAALGESIIGLYPREEMRDLLAEAGFAWVEEVTPADAQSRFGIPILANLDERIVLGRRGS